MVVTGYSQIKLFKLFIFVDLFITFGEISVRTKYKNLQQLNIYFKKKIKSIIEDLALNFKKNYFYFSL